MSLTFTKTKEGVAGDLRYWAGTILLDSSYPTGGYAITATNFLFGSTTYLLNVGESSGVVPEWDRTNSKIKMFYPTGGSAASPAALAAPFVTLASGTSAINSPGLALTDAVTPGQGKEVANATDLSTLTLQAFALGQ